MSETLTALQFVNLIRPRHDRTSCNDDNLVNGFYSRGDGWHGRCTRCMYLEVIRDGGILPDGFKGKECHG